MLWQCAEKQLAIQYRVVHVPWFDRVSELLLASLFDIMWPADVRMIVESSDQLLTLGGDEGGLQ
jgi:hypothetical protein